MNFSTDQVCRRACSLFVFLLSTFAGGVSIQAAETAEEFCIRIAGEMDAGNFESFYEAFDPSEFILRTKSNLTNPEKPMFQAAFVGYTEMIEKGIEGKNLFDDLLTGTLIEFVGLEEDENGEIKALLRFVPEGALAYTLLGLKKTPSDEWRIIDLYGMQIGMWLSEMNSFMIEQRVFHLEEDNVPLWIPVTTKAMQQADQQDYEGFLRSYEFLKKAKKITPQIRSLYVGILAGYDPVRLLEEIETDSGVGPDPTTMVMFSQAMGQRDFESAERWLSQLKKDTFQDPYLAYFDLQIALFKEAWEEAVDAGEALMKRVPKFKSTQLVSIQCLACSKSGQYQKLINVLEFYLPEGAVEFIMKLHAGAGGLEGFFSDPVGQKWLKENGVSSDEIDALLKQSENL